MMLKNYRFFVLLLVLLFPLFGKAQFYYGLHQSFGKNRVQYNDFDWRYYRYEGFDVYFYKNGRNYAQKASVLTERNMKNMQRFLDHALDERIRVIVFNSLTDLKQSNLNPNDEESYNTGGVTRTAGTRMFVYFDGDFAHFEQQIREGLAYLMLSNMLYGGFTSSIKNSALLNLPEWYTEGLISYLARPWDAEIDQHVMDGIASNTYKRMNSLSGYEAKICGHSIWEYIAETYGAGVIKNILYMTILNRSVEGGIESVLGIELNDFITGWRNYYASKYNAIGMGENLEGKPILKSKKEERIFNPVLSQNGRYLAYATNEQGLYKVRLYDFVKDKKKRIIKRGHRIAQNNDYSFPILAWHPNNRILAFITEEKGFIWLYFYDVEKKKLEKRSLFGFEKILSASYSKDGKELLMSAVRRGQTDIFVYTILSTTIDNVTNDEFTDTDPAFINNDKQIVFSSNRTDDSLRDGQKVWQWQPNSDLFIYHRNRDDNEELWRITNTPNENERGATEYAPGYIAFLSNPQQKSERFLIGIDSSIAFVDTITHYNYHFSKYKATHFSRGIAAEDFSSSAERAVNLYFIDKRYRIYESDYIFPEDLNLEDEEGGSKSHAKTREERKRILIDMAPNEDSARAEISKIEVDINNYQFDESLVPNTGPEKQKPKAKVVETPAVQTPKTTHKPQEEDYDFPPARNYFLTFLRDNFTVKIDFVFDNPQYQIFTGRPDGNLLNSGFNMQFKVGAVDLFNNYRVIGGFRTDFQPVPGLSLSPNSEFMVGLIDHKKRTDKILTLYRRSQFTTNSGSLYRLLNHEAHYKAIYPFNEVQSLHGSVGYRHQRGIYLSDGQTPISTPDDVTDYAILKAAFVHDNTRRLGLNLYKGTRYKVFTEYYRNLSTSKTGLHTLGVDFRNYIQLHRTLIFATRVAYGTSFGQEKLIHYMGGVDNALNPKLNQETPVAQDENYVFQTVVTNMRGFRQNVRNGNSFAAVNAELRWPIFNYLINRPLRSDFINNFQVVGFFDVGTAWTGNSPWSDENSFNNREIETGNLQISINRQTNPLIAGTGFGLRSRVLGYFVRADWAWGIENGVVLPNIFYISLSTDF